MVFSICLHAELIFTISFHEYVIEELYDLKGHYYFNKPCLSRELTDKEFSVLYKTNSQGFRIGKSMIQEQTVKDCDWLVIGDSYTQGAQVEFEDLYTSKLYKFFPDKIIVNAGISGFGIPEELELYRDIRQTLRPSKVILQVCNFNDFMKVELKSYGLTDYLMQYSALARSALYGIKYKSPGELPLGRWTEPFCETEKENVEYNVFYRPSNERKDADIKNFEYFLRKFAEETRMDGVELIVLLVPTKEQIYYKDFEEVVDNFHIDIKKLDMNFPNRLLARICSEVGIKLIDLKDSFANHDKRVFFEYDEHLNVEGHNVTSEGLRSYLSKQTDRSEIAVMSKSFYGDRYPSYIDGGSSILFQSFRDGNNEIFVTDSSFGNTTRLTINNVDEVHPSESSDGKLIAVTVGDARTMKTKIELMNANGSERKTITKLPFQYGAIPTFSRNSRMMTFAEWYYNEESGKFTEPQIVVTDLRGKKLYQITDDGIEHWRPVFGPKDSIVVYISRKSGNFDVFEYSLLNRREKQLTTTSYDEWDPQISPDGRRIVFAGQKDGNWDLFELNLESGVTVQVTATRGTEWDPGYSADGSRIIYAGDYGLYKGIYTLDRGRIRN